MPKTAQDVLNDFIRACDAEMCPNVPSPRPPTPEKSAQLRPNVPESAQMCPPPQNCKTNPPPALPKANPGLGREPRNPSPKPLSLRQQPAARLLVLGIGSKRAARHLGINHHTIARWKKNPRFTALIDNYNRALEAGTPDLAKTMT